QLELDGDFNNHIDRDTVALRGRETPLPDGLHRLAVQAAAEALQDPDVADRAVAAHDDFKHDLAPQSLASRVLAVICADLFEQARWIDAAAGSIGSAASSAAGSFSNPGTLTRAEARSRARACATASAGSVAFGLDG